MKPIFGILFLTSFCLGMMAQTPVTTAKDLQQNLMDSGEYIRMPGGSGKINGSPYLTEEFIPGMIHWNNTWHKEIDLRYNIFQGKFEVELDRGIIAIDPIKNNIDTIKYNDEVFVRNYLEDGKDQLVVYLSLLGQQNGYALYKHYQIKFNEAVTDTDLYNEAKPAEYEMQKPAYYVFRGNEQWTVKGNKSLAEIFQVDVKAVRSYLKQNKYRLSNEAQLLEAVLHFAKE